MTLWMRSAGMCVCRKKEVHILGYAPFIMRRRDHFPFLRINRCITALDVEREAMFLHF